MVDVALPHLRRASHYAADKAIKEAKSVTRQTIRTVRLGRLANAVGSTSSLEKGRLAGNAWGAIFARGGINSRANQALMAYTEGAVIVPTGGRKWLAYPAAAAGRLVRMPTARGFGNFKNTPGRYGEKLRFVQFSPRRAALVMDNAIVSNKTGRIRRGAKRPGTASTKKKFVVVFWLIKVTTRAKRFDQHRIVAAAGRRIGDFVEEYGRRFRVGT